MCACVCARADRGGTVRPQNAELGTPQETKHFKAVGDQGIQTNAFNLEALTILTQVRKMPPSYPTPFFHSGQKRQQTCRKAREHQSL